MLSAEDFAAVKLAIELCNCRKLKKEILCLPRKDDGEKSANFDELIKVNDTKKKWDKNLEEKSFILLENIGLGACLQEKVTGLIILIGMRMFIWVAYNECFLGISRDLSIDFFNSSYFTSRGIIDNKKAAQELMKSQKLNIKQRYKLACLYCFADQIPDLFKQLSEEDRKEFLRFEEPRSINLVTYWSYLAMGEVDKLTEGQSVDEYLLDRALTNGSKAAVEYCFVRKGINRNEIPIIDAALKTVKNRKNYWKDYIIHSWDEENGWIAFFYSNFFQNRTFWIPSDYFIDILCLLFDKMTEDQRIEFLRKDSGVVRWFLFWPYQDYFMKAMNLTWDFLPGDIFINLLEEICDNIESESGTLRYGEERTFNYRNLLKVFWCAAPLRYKRDFFYYVGERSIYPTRARVRVYSVLFKLKNFTNEDRKNLELILESATDEERKSFFFSSDGKFIGELLIEENKWKRFQLFVSYFHPNKKQLDDFKRNFFFKSDRQKACFDFLQMDDLPEAESFIKCRVISEKEIIRFKKEMLFSDRAKSALTYVIINFHDIGRADRFCEWFGSSENKLKEFKVSFFSECGEKVCESLVKRDKLGFVDNFICWCLSNTEEMTIFKENFVSKKGGEICKHLILNNSYHYWSCCNFLGVKRVEYIIEFKGDKWEKQAENFLAWCFSTQEETNVFKRNKIFEELGKDILYSFIYANQLNEADTFISWLDLSSDESKALKKDAVFSHMKEIRESVSKSSSLRFLEWEGNKWEHIKRFLRWFLVDKDSVLEFINKFEEGRYGGEIWDGNTNEDNEDTDLYKYYEWIIELLSSLQ